MRELSRVHSVNIREVIERYGETTQYTEAQLQPVFNVSDDYARLAKPKLESLETIAGAQAYLLYDAMKDYVSRHRSITPSEHIPIIRRSRQIPLGYARLPPKAIGDRLLDERSSLVAFQAEPEEWFRLDRRHNQLKFTDGGYEKLHESYDPDRGCPALTMDIMRHDGTRANLFMEYWNTLLIAILHSRDQADVAEEKRRQAFSVIKSEVVVRPVGR